MQLRLFDTVNAAEITEEGTGVPDFKTLVDARAGGLMATESFIYASFTTTGLKKKAISDEAAFASLDWDIAIRRYVVRVNSGVSGPSCAEVGRTAPGTTFDALTNVPAGISWRTEEYFTSTCDFVPDTSGIGAPGTALSSFWTYQTCVQMTGNVYVVHLRDGSYVKLQVLSYYAPTQQDECNATGSNTPTDAGLIRMRWAFIAGPTP